MLHGAYANFFIHLCESGLHRFYVTISNME